MHLSKCCILYTLYRLFQDVKDFQQTIEIFHNFSPRNVTGANPPTPPPRQRPYDVSHGQNRYVTLPLWTVVKPAPQFSHAMQI